MPSLSQRLRKLQTKLLAIRLGSGALILPKEVKRIHMRFATRIEGGHMGPRKFWRHELVRLKYHNPAVPMEVERHTNNDPESTEAVMSISFAQPPTTESSPSNPATAPTANPTSSSSSPAERTETINLLNLTSSEILRELVRLTNAYPVEPTPEEQQELRLLEEQRLRGERDRRGSLEVRARVKRERMLLEQARGEMATEAA